MPRHHSSAKHAPPASAVIGPWYRRGIPWLAIGISLAVLITAAFAVAPVRDAATFESVGEASLELSAGYLSIAPISNVLDTLTLLTIGQHVALLLWAIAIYIVVRVWRGRRGRSTVGRESLFAVVFLACIVLVYAVMALVPRPMAALVASDPTVLIADFHSHTQYSHDGRSGWTEDKVREWHRSAGYDVAYITDHATYEGAERGIAANPGQAGEGTMLMQGIEAIYQGEHVNVLDAGRRYNGLTTPNLKDVDEQALALASLIPATTPVVIETVPGNLNKVPAATRVGVPGVDAIEIVDGSPRGLTQSRRDHARIVHLADSLNLALVTGSDNHGYGRAAPGWTLLRIPDWRGMATDSLMRYVEDVLRVGRRESTRTVERRVANGTNPIALAFAGPVIVWRMFTTLSPDERVMWLIWTWLLVIVVRGLRSYRERRVASA
ncbi:MAG TPA: hypothetical protein VHB25_09375 [Gemmatimonadaceae bacterium]|nr:hypothetical protein [Gemmatimonadaceae bacterium]